VKKNLNQCSAKDGSERKSCRAQKEGRERFFLNQKRKNAGMWRKTEKRQVEENWESSLLGGTRSCKKKETKSGRRREALFQYWSEEGKKALQQWEGGWVGPQEMKTFPAKT